MLRCVFLLWCVCLLRYVCCDVCVEVFVLVCVC